jgi:hypothetical protein
MHCGKSRVQSQRCYQRVGGCRRGCAFHLGAILVGYWVARGAVYQDILLVVIINAPDNEGRGVFDKLVLLPALFKVDLASNGITQVDLTVHEIVQGRTVGIYKENRVEQVNISQRQLSPFYAS